MVAGNLAYVIEIHSQMGGPVDWLTVAVVTPVSLGGRVHMLTFYSQFIALFVKVLLHRLNKLPTFRSVRNFIELIGGMLVIADRLYPTPRTRKGRLISNLRYCLIRISYMTRRCAGIDGSFLKTPHTGRTEPSCLVI